MNKTLVSTMFLVLAVTVFVVCLVMMTGCTTTVSPDGTRTTTTDTKAIRLIAGSALEGYRLYRLTPERHTLYDGKQVIQPVVK